jgi:hypothetical protein
MSDTSQGAGWWLASDGRWYPPETWTGPPQVVGAPSYPSQGMPYQGAPYQTATQGYPGVPVAMARPTNGMSIASLVCSCAGIIPFLFGIPCVLGVVFGFVARSQIRRSAGGQGGDGLALAGIIVGFCLIAIFIVAVILIAVFANTQNCNNNFSSYSCAVN